MHINPARLLGGLCAMFGVILIFVWAPLDSGSWYVMRVRGNYAVGDAMAPSFAGLIFVIGGAILALFGARAEDPSPDRRDMAFILTVVGIVLAGLVAMRFSGPLAAAFTESEYRHLRDTAPWKYLGFGFGGFGMVAALVAYVEGRFSWRATAAGCVAVLLIIAIYDLPFEDLILPPNGDV